MAPRSWLPPVAWMAVVFALSTDLGSAERTAHWLDPIVSTLLPWVTPAQAAAAHAIVRKGAHLTEYAVLGALWVRAFAGGQGWRPAAAGWSAFALAAAWAVVDEAHQAFVASRGGSAADVALDAIGAALGVLGALAGWRRAVGGLTTILLWIAAVGGGIALAVDAAAGVRSGLLWVTAPAAGLLLLVRRRWTARGPAPAPRR